MANNSNENLNRAVTWMNLIWVGLCIIGLFLAVYVQAHTDIESLKKDVTNHHSQIQELKTTITEQNRLLEGKLDKILDKVTDIEIEMQNKADR